MKNATMANHEAYQKVFYPGRPHGIKGQIKYSSVYPMFEEMLDVKVLFIHKGGSFLPYFIEEIDLLDADTCFIKWEECDSKESAMTFCKYELFIHQDDLESYFDLEENPFEKLIGYTCYDPLGEKIGEIIDIEAFPGQMMAHIDYKGKEIMIPLAEELMGQTDDKKQSIIFNLPEGFLAIFD
jgi:16S rRNA processing protein RimM